MSKMINRRDFLKSSAAILAGTALGGITGSAVSFADEAKGKYTPGTYEATVQGYTSFVTVRMEFDKDRILSCDIDASGETAGIGQAAAAEYAALVVSGQDVDAVTSATATVTLPAVRKGVQNCIDQALGKTMAINEAASAANEGSDWLGEAPLIDDSMITGTFTTDLLIVGAGNAGMMAAATAADAGMDFMICEKNATVGDTRFWVGTFNSEQAVSAGHEMSKTKAMNELARYASYKCDMEVIRMWLDNSQEVLKYWESLGVVAEWHEDLGNHVGGEEMTYVVPSMWHTLHATGKYADFELHPFFGANRTALLEAHIGELGYKVNYQMDLVRLTQDDFGKVTGAIFANANGEYVRVKANNTLLCTGGYAANGRMVSALAPIVPRCTTTALYFGSNTGSGIKAGIWAGGIKDAEAAPMIFDRALVPPDIKAGYVADEYGNLFWPGDTAFGQTNLSSQPHLKVNKDGRRFANESCPYDFISFAAAQQKDGVYACIFDSDIVEDVLAYKQYGCAKWTYTDAEAGILPDTIESLVQSGMLFRCDTVEELAEKLNIPVDIFVQTVKRYNELCEKGVDEDFGKEPYRMRALDHAPYYGGFFGGSLLTTSDGLQINRKCQVLRGSDRSPIEGLYSAGDCSGSFFSGNYPEYFVGVASSRAMTQGRYAVKAILGEEF